MRKNVLIVFLCLMYAPLLAQNSSDSYQISSFSEGYGSAPRKQSKIGSNLATQHAQLQKSRHAAHDTTAQYVTIDAVAQQNTQQLLKDLQALGLKNGSTFGRMVSGRIPVSSIQSLNSMESLLFARQALGSTNVGQATSQGVLSVQADKARAELCVDGTGVKVGVMSDSYDRLGGSAGGVVSGDLPGKKNPNGYKTPIDVVQDFTFRGADEGRAMLEIVHDVAPGAALAFHTTLLGQSGFAQGIRQLAKANCDIIIDDWKYFAEPFFQDGIITQAIDEVVAKGATYLTFAGNHARLSYEKEFRGKKIKINGEKVTAHNFKGGDVFQRILVPPGRTMTISLQWKDRYASVKPDAEGAATDLDIFLLDQSASNILVESSSNNIGFDPIEIITYTNNTNTFQGLNVLITKFSGPSPELIKYVVFNQSNSAIIDEYATRSPTIVGHSNAASAITVGAAAYSDTPAFGRKKPVTQPFSSAGGVPIFFDVDGNDIGKVVRNKPEITAPDGGNNTFFGRDTDFDGLPNFFGTSASVPHAAGVAALMLEASEKQITPRKVGEVLQTTAIKMDDPSTSGAGLIQADKAVQEVTIKDNCNMYAASVTQFKLIDAVSDTPLQTLKDGDIIDLNNIGNVPLNIRAIANPRKVGSMEFVLAGPLDIHRKENKKPYALIGDLPPGQYGGERFPTGSYTLTATPYEERNLKGNAGASNTIQFEIIANYEVLSFSVIDADADEEIGSLNDGQVIYLSPEENINIRAIPSVEKVGSVKFVLDGPVSEQRVENVVPYALFGDLPPFAYGGRNLPAGEYTLTATPYAKARARGMKGSPLTIAFEVEENSTKNSVQALKPDGDIVARKSSNIRLFPIPVKDKLTIVQEGGKPEKVRLILYEGLTGKIVESRYISGKEETKLNLQHLRTGNYIVKIVSAHQAETFKVFKY